MEYKLLRQNTKAQVHNTGNEIVPRFSKDATNVLQTWCTHNGSDAMLLLSKYKNIILYRGSNYTTIPATSSFRAHL